MSEKMYPCDDCEKLRTKAQGGTTFTVCDECWDRRHPPSPEVLAPFRIAVLKDALREALDIASDERWTSRDPSMREAQKARIAELRVLVDGTP